MRPREVFSTVLASTLGIGNIVGMGTAIVTGGPGAIFWCWICGILGSATRYAETFLAVKFRVKDQNGNIKGGPMYIMERGLHRKWMGKWYAALGLVVAFGSGCFIQVCSVANVVDQNVQTALIGTNNFFTEIVQRYPWITKLIVGTLIALLTILVILGGIKSISGLCRKMLPFMLGLYIVECVMILVINHEWILKACSVILRSAFGDTKAIIGGIAGMSVLKILRYGAASGIFSGEVGLGAAGMIEVQTTSTHPAKQGIISSLGSMIDTTMMCILTGLVLMTSILKNGILINELSEIELITAAFSQLPGFGKAALILGIMIFAYTTILGWSYYGEQCAQYLFGNKVRGKYQIFWIVFLIIAPILQISLLIDFFHLAHAAMIVPNVIALLILSPIVKKETDNYLKYPWKKEQTILEEKNKEQESKMFL